MNRRCWYVALTLSLAFAPFAMSASSPSIAAPGPRDVATDRGNAPADAIHAAAPFERLAAAFIGEAERRDPLFADQVGIHAYDDALADYSAHGYAQRIAWLGRARARIARAGTGLTLPAKADAQALLDTIDLELFENETVKPARRDPTYYTSVIGQAMYALVGRHYATPDERLRHVAPRLRRIPAIVAAAEAMLTRPPRAATLQAIDENTGNVALYESLRAESSGASVRTQRAIAKALPRAMASLRGFSTYLRRVLLLRSDGDPRVGALVYDRELRLADGTNESRTQLVADARSDFEQNRARMLTLAIPFDRQFFPARRADEAKPNAEDVVVRRVLDRLADRHPTRSEIFTTAESDVSAAERFLRATSVVTLPSPPSLAVVPTPAFMAGFSGASLDPAGPYTPLATSYFYIDRIPPAWSRARVQSYLRDYNDYELQLLAFHEAVPGHYVQFRYDDRVASPVRRLFPSGAFAEGWAVYGEGMMLDAGFGGNDPALRLFQLKWRLREEADTLIDAAFHTGHLNRDGCFDLLERQAYQNRSEALTKWHRLQLSHDQLTSYFVGLDAIRHAEAVQRTRLGTRFSVRRFNAALLHMGSVEPRFIVPLLNMNVR